MAVLDVLEREGIQQNVIAAGKVLEAGLAKLAAKYPLVADVRGKGLFWGLEIVRDHATRAPAVEEADRIMNLLREDGFLLGRTGAFDNVIKVRPPLVFTPDNARMLLEGLDRALTNVLSVRSQIENSQRAPATKFDETAGQALGFLLLRPLRRIECWQPGCPTSLPPKPGVYSDLPESHPRSHTLRLPHVI